MATDFLSAYVADFETTTDPEDCRVWLWAYCPVTAPSETRYGTTIRSFLVDCSDRLGTVFFHNLAFDGKFILDALFRGGYDHKFSKYGYNNVRMMKRGTFFTVISDLGQFYTITVRWKNGNTTVFYDSLKKIPISVRAIATTYHLDESKGDIDYRAPRGPGYVPSEQELDYIRRDVGIVAQALEQNILAGMSHMTVASDSMAQYKETVGKDFEENFPNLGDDVDSIVREAYRGGFTYSAPQFRDRHIGEGIVFDVNSLYPSVMRTATLPYGMPEVHIYSADSDENWNAIQRPWFTGEGLYDRLWIASIEFTARLKKNHIPCIQLHNIPGYKPQEYQENIREPISLTVSSVDWKLICDQYNVELMGVGGILYFDGKTGMFDDYIDYWGSVKEHATGGERYIAKLHLNSLYGKFGTNPHTRSKYPVFEDNMVKYRLGEEEDRPQVYTPMAVFVTAYARNKTIRTAQSVYNRFCYADTDSIHLTGTDIPNIDVHPTRLGAWKHESTFSDAIFKRAKQYLEVIDGKRVAHIAGMPLPMREGLTLDDMVTGGEFWGKLVPRTVPGGVILRETSFTLE